MKKLNKVFVLVMAVIMTLAMSASVFAQSVAADPKDDDKATITINNPANGETYTIYKVFDATVGENGEIAYKATTIPSELSTYFEETYTGSGYVKPTDAAWKDPSTKKDMSDGLKAALETWAGSATSTASAKSNGDPTLAFTDLPFGYYVITTTHKDSTTGKAAITVDSTNPNAVVYDKNTTVVTADKTVDDTSYSIGDTITFTATFDTTNYVGSGSDAKKVYTYLIEDTLPEYLSNVAITSITIGGTAWADAPSAFTNKQIEIPWVDANGASLYANGAKIVVTYTAKLTDTVNVNAANKNTISITPLDDKDKPYQEPIKDSAEITTYAAALKKLDDKNNALAGAKFKADGLTVEKTADGVYTVKSFDPNSTTLGTEMEVDANGMLYIVGLKDEAKVMVTETEAPDGFNKLQGKTELNPQVLTKEVYKMSGTRYYDADGNLVKEESSSTTSKTVDKNLNELDAKALKIINEPGVVLPGTGGIGTTIFYILGSLLVVGCGIVLVSRKRMQNNK